MTLDEARARARRLAGDYLERGDAVGWFEPLYADAEGDPGAIQWADRCLNPILVAWLDRVRGVAARGFAVVAFDVAPSAVAWCPRRYPDSPVEYRAAGLDELRFEDYLDDETPPARRFRIEYRRAATARR